MFDDIRNASLCYLLTLGGTSGSEFVNRRSSVRIRPLAVSESVSSADIILTQPRLDRDRAERRRKREEEAAGIKAEQATLFTL